MWQRPNPSARQTGANEAPLNGGGRRWGGAGDSNSPSSTNQSSPPPSFGNNGGYEDRGRSSSRFESKGPYDRPNMPQNQPGYQPPPGGGGGGYHSNYQNNDRRSGSGPPQPPAYGMASYGMDPNAKQDSPATTGEPGERKRKSRWGDQKAVGGMATALTGTVEGKDLEVYAG
jgi:splicing factor 1